MAHFNSADPRNKPESGFTRMRTLELERLESRSLESYPETPRPTAIGGDVAHHLATLADSEKYQLALVPRTTPDFSASSAAASRFVTMRVVLLPLTWKDISRLVRDETRTSTFNTSINDTIKFNEVCIDFYRMRVTRASEDVALTALEFKVLKFLMTNQDR